MLFYTNFVLLSKYISNETNIPLKSIENTIQLLKEDCTIPFISRYRKERTGNLDEVQIGEIVKIKTVFEELGKRKTTILKALKEQEVLTDELKMKIDKTNDLLSLEDIYLPFKKKRKTKGDIARENGLESMAKIIMSQKSNDLEYIAYKYCNKELESVEVVLEGARHIIAEWINERIDIRNQLRYQIDKFGQITTKVIKSEANGDKAQKFRDYFDWSEALNRCPSHRLLAILRAEKEGFIRLKIKIDDERAIQKMEERIIRSSNACSNQIKIAIKDAYKRLLLPSITNEALTKAKVRTDEDAIQVFAKNLRQLLLSAPLGEKNILAIDPGFRTGCKVVCLNARGGLEYNETIYPHAPKNDRIGAIKKINSLVDAYKIDAIAVGNGTASRETEALIRKMRFQKDVQVFIVNEAGASIYSASSIAREEFPNYDVTVRGAISIGRRLSDPLAELVKIDAKSLGIGQYQHDVDQKKLKNSLDTVVESCVNNVGVNLNTASKPLLSYVSGIGPNLAEKIVKYREENGLFNDRNDLKKLSGLGNKAFEQSAGFLRIKNADSPLDDSAVHPESYNIVHLMAKELKMDLIQLIGNEKALASLDLNKFCDNKIGLPTLTDIINELKKPGLDPREKAKVFTFNQNIQTINDLREGQLLPGIVNNITNFGCFVDIGIKESGLIHVSNLSNDFVKDVGEIVHLHQQIIVKVLEVDVVRKRIQLALKSN